ncbi:hypothetical protein ACFY8C_06575 [Streptomyces flavochromogenes]|uniref:Uncharacterized protein n=1 Tax=Streptomyces flavochromogenes TaxID=68199 RepID=A0ABW6XKG5_9ACTN|nr:hypothetical protein [Streptomyces flavochromogenes]
MAEDIPTLIADLKITVVQGHIRQIIEHSHVMRDLSSITSTLNHLKEKIEEIHKEIVKNPVTEYWEAAGFDGIAAGIEKLYEGEGLGTALNYWLSNGAGAFAAIVIGGIGLYLAGKLTNIQRSIQAALRPSGLIRAYNANGDVTLQRRTDVEARERRVANGGTGVADLVGDPANAERARRLREQLVPLNKAVDRFDKLAPTFLESFAKLPSERRATKAATAVGKISSAVNLVNRTALKEVVEGYEKLNKAVAEYQPTKIPKEAELAGVARKMNDLANETQTLRDKFNGLRGTIESLDSVIAGATG